MSFRNRTVTIAIVLLIITLFFSCTQKPGQMEMKIEQQFFGTTPDGINVDLFTLTNSKGVKIEITNYGGIVVSLFVPDRDGEMDDIVLGYKTLDKYIENSPYFGALIGRYGNRIGKGKFVLDGEEYTLAANNDENHLHGGIKGFDKVAWDAETVKEENQVGVRLKYHSKDGEEGYPGNLECTVTYLLTNDNELKILYEAVTDKATPVNLTHHSYFNLTGRENRDILDHDLILNADQYTPVDEGLIPTGELKSVKDTPMDFTSSKSIGKEIADVPGGYDHNFVLNSDYGNIVLAAQVYEPVTGRVMEVYTDEPGLQFYSGNFLDGTITGKYEIVYKKHFGFCLEAQHYPDSPNKPDFPSAILRPGEIYSQETIYKFYSK
ncbi:aldose epimerase family protein [candidate division KSB1 bacterium]